MGDKITLTLDERTAHGKKVKALRREGITPGVVYGPGTDPIAVQADSVIMNKVLRSAGKHAPVHLTIGKIKKIAMIKDTDIDPLRNTINHVSFHAVKQNELVEAEIPVKLQGEGESEAERAGMIILQNIESLHVKALPMDLPDALLVDITGLKDSGDRVTVGDIVMPENVELVDNDSGHHEEGEETHSVTELVVATAYEPSALAAANDAAGGDAEDESAVEADNGGDTDQGSQTEETQPGGKLQDEPKQSNVDANK